MLGVTSHPVTDPLGENRRNPAKKQEFSIVVYILSISTFCSEHTLCTSSCTVGKKQVPFSMAIANVKLTHKCFPNTHAWKQQE